MTATKQQQPARDEKGRLLCVECRGDKVVEVQGHGHSAALEPPTYLEECEACSGTGLRICPQCAEPARVVGENGVQAYCDTAHAWADSNWPACPVCLERPQHAALAPFCGDRCEAAFRARFEGRPTEARS